MKDPVPLTLRAIIFDVDGTLAETEDLHRLAFNDGFLACGLPWSWSREVFAKLLSISGGRERIRGFLTQVNPAMAERPDFDAVVRAIHVEKSRCYTEAVQNGALTARPGIKRLIDEARAAGLALALATSSQRISVDIMLPMVLGPEAPEWFRAIGCGEDVTHKKPSPEVYQYVLEHLGLQPHECIAIEDTEIGLTAARAAGIPTVVTISSYSGNEDFTGAAVVLPDLGETEVTHLHHWHQIALSSRT